MRYLLLSVLVVCMIGVMVPSAFTQSDTMIEGGIEYERYCDLHDMQYNAYKEPGYQCQGWKETDRSYEKRVLIPLYANVAIIVIAIGAAISIIAVIVKSRKKKKLESVKRKPAKKKKTSTFCENCGNTLNPKAKFCGSCGTKIESNLVFEQTEDDSHVSPLRKRSSLWYLLPVFTGIIGIIAFFVLRKDDPEKAKLCLYLSVGVSVIGMFGSWFLALPLGCYWCFLLPP